MKRAAAAALLFLSMTLPCHAETRNITTVDPDQVSQLEMLHQRASDLVLKNDFQAAIRAYSDILLLEPDDEAAYTALGQIHMVLGQTKKAHEAFANALHINPENGVALAGIQRILDPDGMEGMVPVHETGEIIDTSPREELPEEPPPPVKVAVLPEPVVQKTVEAPAAKTPISQNFRVGKLHVQRVQMALKNAGCYNGPIDGMFGKSMKQSLRDFQKKEGLEITGSVNPSTWSRLAGYLDPANRSSNDLFQQ